LTFRLAIINLVHSDVRFGNLALELSELCSGQPAILVVVEALDEVQCSVLGIIEFLAQHRHRLIERYERFTANSTYKIVLSSSEDLNLGYYEMIRNGFLHTHHSFPPIPSSTNSFYFNASDYLSFNPYQGQKY